MAKYTWSIFIRFHVKKTCVIGETGLRYKKKLEPKKRNCAKGIGTRIITVPIEGDAHLRC